MSIRNLLVIASVVLGVGCRADVAESPATEIEFLNMTNPAASGLPFSDAVRVGNVIYLSGVIGTDSTDMKTVEGGITAETTRAMEIIKTRLEAFGSSMDRVVKCTAFLADEADRSAMNAVYSSYFDTPPARSGVTVKAIALGARMELECIAVVK